MSAVTRMVYKDWLVNRSIVLTTVAVLLLFAFGVLPVRGTAALGVMLAIIFVFTSSTQDERNNTHVFVNSLPVSRPDVVTGKYVFNIGVGIVYAAVATLLPGLLDHAPLKGMLAQLLLAAGIISVFVSAFMPMYYWLGPRFVRLGMFVAFVVLVAVVPPVHTWAMRNRYWGILAWLASLPPLPFGLVASAAVLVFVLASWRLSVALYRRQEF